MNLGSFSVGNVRETTTQRLQKKGINLQQGIQLIQDGHENIELYVQEEVDAAMFNLGYLPGGDRHIITRPTTTIKALEVVLKLLKKGGLLSIMTYYGHEGGNLEKEQS